MNYWQFKFKEELWDGFEKLEIGDVFDTTVREVHKLSNRIGDIVFWYKKDNNKNSKKGIYFVSEIISEPRENEEFGNGYSIDLRILKSLVNEPFILEENGFADLVSKINKKQQAGTKYLFEDEDKGDELYELLSVGDVQKQSEIKIEQQLIDNIKQIKDANINDGNMFNPFLDMNLIKGEVKHISFIANLLNPRGTHFERNLFLKKFIDVLKDKANGYKDYLDNFDTDNANVITEKLTDTNKRIDLWIEDDNFIIAIEGKVDTEDSFNQLNNYDRYLKKQKKPYILIYLTKEGYEPVNDYPSSTILIGFKNEIIKTIENSLINKIHPKVEATLREYKNALLTYIYGLESTWKYSYDIISEIIKSEESFKKYRDIKNFYYYDKKRYVLTVVEDIAKNFEKSKAKIELEFFLKIKKAIQNKFEIEFLNDDYSNVLNGNESIDLMNDIETVYLARRNRVFSKGDDAIQISFKKNTSHFVIASNSYGLVVFKIIENDNDENYEICDYKIFNSDNISKLLNENVASIYIDKILNILETK